MNISKLTILCFFLIGCCLASCDSATDAPNTPEEFAKLTILPAPGYYPIGYTQTMSFAGIEIDTAKYQYSWTLNDTLTIDSQGFSHKFESSGRYEATLRIYTKKDSKLTAKVSTVLLIAQNYLSIDTLKTFTKLKVEFGGFGRIETRKDTIYSYKDTLFRLHLPNFYKFIVTNDTSLLINEGYYHITRTTRSETSEGWDVLLDSYFDTSLQLLQIQTLYISDGRSSQQSVPGGWLFGGGGYTFIINSLSIPFKETTNEDCIFEYPSSELPTAVPHITFGNGISQSYQGTGSVWTSKYYSKLKQIHYSSAIRPYLRIIFQK